MSIPKLTVVLAGACAVLQVVVVAAFGLWHSGDVIDSGGTYAEIRDWAQDGGYELLLVAPPLAVVTVGLVAYQLRQRWMLIVGCLAIVLLGAGGPIAVMTIVEAR